MYIVEYYSNDNGEWTGSVWEYIDYTKAVEMMRRQAGDHPDMAYRIVQIEVVRTTVALASQGEELVKC